MSEIECNYCGDNIIINDYLEHISNCKSNACNEYFNDYYSEDINYDDAIQNISLRNNTFTEDEISTINDELFDDEFNPDDSEQLQDIEIINVISRNNINPDIHDIDPELRQYIIRTLNNCEEFKVGLSNIKNYSERIKLEENTECVICLDKKTKGEEFNKMICNHSFCIKCSNQWFSNNNTCPLCNQNLRNLKKNNNKIIIK